MEHDGLSLSIMSRGVPTKCDGIAGLQGSEREALRDRGPAGRRWARSGADPDFHGASNPDKTLLAHESCSECHRMQSAPFFHLEFRDDHISPFPAFLNNLQFTPLRGLSPVI